MDKVTPLVIDMAEISRVLANKSSFRKTVSIYVEQAHNDKFFNQKLPTFRNTGFCYISRVVTFSKAEGNELYGQIKANGKILAVYGSVNSYGILTDMTIEGEIKN